MKTVWVITYNFNDEMKVTNTMHHAFVLAHKEIINLYGKDEKEYHRAFKELKESHKKAIYNDYPCFGADDIVTAKRVDFEEEDEILY